MYICICVCISTCTVLGLRAYVLGLLTMGNRTSHEGLKYLHAHLAGGTRACCPKNVSKSTHPELFFGLFSAFSRMQKMFNDM